MSGGKRGSRGFFYNPTVVEIRNEKAMLLGEECFGPVLPLIRVESIDDAIVATNQSLFGLGASIWTSAPKEAQKIARQLSCGMIWINDVNVAFPETPWGGVKSSGIGFELSDYAFDEYTTKQHINIETSSDATRVWWYPYGE